MKAKMINREGSAPAVEKPAPTPVREAANAPQIPGDKELLDMIAEAAYYRAQKRGFAPGAEAEDWLQAEAEVLEKVRAAQARP
jgi:hypothetical protein